MPPRHITAADLALAEQLYAADLAPPGTTRFEPGGPYWYGAPHTRLWRPWEDIAAVWHLVAYFGIDVRSSGQWSVASDQQGVRKLATSHQPLITLDGGSAQETVTSWAEVPAAIARLALTMMLHDTGERVC